MGSDGGQGGRVPRRAATWLAERGSRLHDAAAGGGRRRRGEHAPRLWEFWATAPLVVAVGGAAAWLVFLRLRDAAVPKRVEGCPTCPPQVDTLDVTRTTWR